MTVESDRNQEQREETPDFVSADMMIRFHRAENDQTPIEYEFPLDAESAQTIWDFLQAERTPFMALFAFMHHVVEQIVRSVDDEDEEDAGGMSIEGHAQEDPENPLDSPDRQE